MELAATAGLVADPWQADQVNVMSAVRPDGKWLCFECAEIVARQNGKGCIGEIRVLSGLYLYGERLIIWSAHQFRTAMEAFRRILGLIESSDDLHRRVYRVNNANGDEGIELKGEGTRLITGRQRLRFLARSKGSGRGFSAECNVIDEAFALTDEQLAALMPALSAMWNPQILYLSSPPLDASTGEPLFALRERGEAGDPGLFWRDWGAPPTVDPNDRRWWYATNPAMPTRISEEQVERERRAMTDEGFLRERLCVWPSRAGSALIGEQVWRDLAAQLAARPDDLALAVDVTPMRDHSAIMAAGPDADGNLQVSVVDYRAGTEWLVPRLAELNGRYRPVAVGLDVKGPAGSLLPDLARVGIRPPADPDRPQRGDLAVPTTADVASAFAWFIDRVNQGTLRHLDEAPLNVAVAGAKTRNLVGGGRAWDRNGAADISPLVGGTTALWAYLTRAELVRARTADIYAGSFG